MKHALSDMINDFSDMQHKLFNQQRLPYEKKESNIDKIVEKVCDI
jgi:hypothetical protein